MRQRLFECLSCILPGKSIVNLMSAVRPLYGRGEQLTKVDPIGRAAHVTCGRWPGSSSQWAGGHLAGGTPISPHFTPPQPTRRPGRGLGVSVKAGLGG